MPSLEVGGRGNEGRRAELPVGLCHPGYGGLRRRALPAGGRLLHSASASGRNLLVMFDVTGVKTLFTLRVYFLSLKCLICCWTLPLPLISSGLMQVKVNRGTKCLALLRLLLTSLVVSSDACWFAFVRMSTSVLWRQAYLSFKC